MNEFHAYIPYVNRPDLLKRAIDSVPELWDHLTIVDNSENGLSFDLVEANLTIPTESVTVFTPPVPLTFTQSQNLFFKNAKRKGCRFILWLHNDCLIPAGTVKQLLDRVDSYYSEGRKWGVAFTYYDIFSAVNLEMVEEVGGYDTNIRAYCSDQDYYHRVRRAGWETISTEIEVEAIKNGHLGSQTIRSDERISLINGIVQTADAFYRESKWGGEAGNEQYEYPFNRPDLFPKGK